MEVTGRSRTADAEPSGCVRLLKPRRFSDTRGWFTETYSARSAAAAGIDTVFVQDNQSFSASAGTIRGLHYQRPPHAQSKLVRCVRGAIMDYAVDIRRGSPTFGRYVAARLSDRDGLQLFIPSGFAHAFMTLEPDVEVAYKVSDFYAPDCEGGVAWNDPDLAIDWLVASDSVVLSDKDLALPRLAGFDSPFEYDGRPMGRPGIISGDDACAY